MNIHIIVNKINVFQNYVYSRSPNIIGVTETWLSDKIFDNELLYIYPVLTQYFEKTVDLVVAV